MTSCGGARAAGNFDPTTHRQPTDLSVEVKPVAMSGVREVVRRAEGTSCFFVAAVTCAIPTPRAARACVRAFRPSWQRAADNKQRGELSCN